MKILKTVLYCSFFYFSSPSTFAGTVHYFGGEALPKISKSISTDVILKQSIKTLKLQVDPSQFALLEVKESLLGHHYTFQQTLQGVEMEGAQLVVTVDPALKSLKSIYDASVSPSSQKSMSTLPSISTQSALDVAWNYLNSNGELLSDPQIKLMISLNQTLVYQVYLATSSPFGHRMFFVDAKNGNVIKVEDAALPRMKRAASQPIDAKAVQVKGAKVVSFSSALKKLHKRNAQKIQILPVNFSSGSAMVFDPNPVVELGRDDLQDTSAQDLFTQAYLKVDLEGISLKGGKYFLKGSKVSLIDFEGPTVAPTESTNGQWNFERNQSGFTDAMTYYHIDKSIRYIESLGFTGSRVVFPKTIEVDADGLNGEDNSHYIPSERRLAFGHGCVDDNEDSEVILHELGHAIQHHINSSWSGGDTGAMGEGFGDYWATSYSASTPHGLDATHPEWVFKWDGHNKCWPGRKLNAFRPAYDPAQTYSAHSNVNGGISDEVWSTPIFQAFLELFKRGVARGDIDKIILQAHFGLGFGVKMPQMATSIVKTAKALFPAKDYDQVFMKHFKNQKIL